MVSGQSKQPVGQVRFPDKPSAQSIQHAYITRDGEGTAYNQGRGEAVIKTCGSFLVVENMRRGMAPEKACKAALDRILKKHGSQVDFQVGYIAVNKKGETGAFSLTEGFEYALKRDGKNELIKAGYLQ